MGAYLELLLVFGSALGWGILELVTLRMDKRRAAQAEREKSALPVQVD